MTDRPSAKRLDEIKKHTERTSWDEAAIETHEMLEEARDDRRDLLAEIAALTTEHQGTPLSPDTVTLKREAVEALVEIIEARHAYCVGDKRLPCFLPTTDGYCNFSGVRILKECRKRRRRALGVGEE
jgi:hypothetical protein